MQVFPIESGPVDTIGYLVSSEDTGSAIIIDTPMDSAGEFLEIIREKNLRIEAIVLTHSHWDHMADAAKLKRLTGAPVLVHQDDEYRLHDPKLHTVWSLPFEIESVEPDKHLVHGDILSVGSLNFQMLHTPGHTEGSICLVEHDQGVVFSGDTLFCESVGRIDLPGGSGDTLLKSIKTQILTLPKHYKVFSGHGIPTEIGAEIENNPFLNTDSF